MGGGQHRCVHCLPHGKLVYHQHRSSEAGDKPDAALPAEALAELSQAKGPVFEMGKDPWWGWKEEEGKWGWTRAPPVSQRTGGGGGGEGKKRNKVRVDGAVGMRCT